MRTPLPLLAAFFTVGIAFTGCMKDDDYTVSPNDRLTFSSDTIRFDTIISGEPTRTMSMAVYNTASKAIRISRIGLAKGADSPFHVNADGTQLFGGSAEDFEIPAQDSMVVFLMAKVPETGGAEPVDYTDQLQFTTEAGTQQSVTLTASGQDVVRLQGKRITEDETFSDARPYRITDSLVVETGKTLTLAAGTTLMFSSGAGLIVHGTLKVQGSLQSPVTLRGDRLDNMFTNQPYDRTPGLWEGIHLCNGSYGNVIEYADIHSAVNAVQADSSNVSQEKLRLLNSIVTTSSQCGLNLRMCKAYVGNSQITNAGADCVRLRGGDLEMVHCTVGRFYVFTGASGGHAIDFANFDGDSRLPLTRLEARSCIITGYQDDELMGNRSTENETDAFNYHFDHCLLNTPAVTEGDEAVNFVSCLWDQKAEGTETDDPANETIRAKNFTPEFNTSHLLFSFELAKDSKAVGNANPSDSSIFPTDRLGRTRSGNPDIGCYQHQEETKE